MSFNLILKELRKERNLSQSQLASVLSVDQTTIKNWEHGINETDFKMLCKIANYFEVTVGQLLGEEEY